jgi:hypothetical protein
MPTTIFSSTQLAQIIKETIPAEVPSDSKYVVVGGIDAAGLKVVAAFTFLNTTSGQAKFMGAYHHDWTGDDSVGVQVLWYSK